jgi:hypothetical protein
MSLLQQLPDWGNLEEVLLFLAAGGSAVAVAALFSFLAENFEFWHKISAKGKLILSFVFSIAIGAGAYYLLSLPDLISFVQPYYALVVTIVLAWLSSQYAYMRIKASGYAAKTRATALGIKLK